MSSPELVRQDSAATGRKDAKRVLSLTRTLTLSVPCTPRWLTDASQPRLSISGPQLRGWRSRDVTGRRANQISRWGCGHAPRACPRARGAEKRSSWNVKVCLSWTWIMLSNIFFPQKNKKPHLNVVSRFLYLWWRRQALMSMWKIPDVLRWRKLVAPEQK